MSGGIATLRLKQAWRECRQHAHYTEGLTLSICLSEALNVF